MKRIISICAWLCAAAVMTATELPPIFTETFDRCIDAEDENYGYTGGNDEQWGGDIAKAIVVYDDNQGWSYTYCNGAYQCLKVGTSTKQGSATTPAIEFEGDAVLTCRVAPWEGDSIFTISLSGGTTTDDTWFHLPKHKWTNITVRISDIQGSLKITFSSQAKHRFFLDDVVVRPADPDAGSIRVAEGGTVDWGLLGAYYEASKRVLHVKGANLSNDGISVTMQDGEPGLFYLATNHLPAEGGELAVTCRTGADYGQHGTYLYLRGKDKSNGKTIEKRVTLVMEVADIDLDGAGTRPDPYTCHDVITLAANDGTVWTGTYYWVTGYVLGGVKRYNDQYDGISLTDKLSLVLADDPEETNDNKYVTVQIGNQAREALNVVDNPELIGKPVKVQGLLLNSNANPLYLGKPGVRNVNTDAQYFRPLKDGTVVDDPMDGIHDPDEEIDPYNPEQTAVEQVAKEVVPPFDPEQPYYTLFGVRVRGNGYHGVVIQNGHTYLR